MRVDARRHGTVLVVNGAPETMLGIGAHTVKDRFATCALANVRADLDGAGQLIGGNAVKPSASQYFFPSKNTKMAGRSVPSRIVCA
jgi:hypothetical protein